MTNTKDWQKIKEDSLNEDLAATDMQDEGVDDASGDDGDTTDEHTNESLEYLSYQQLEEKLTLAEQQAHDHWEKLVRATAEVDNIRRRAERDISNAHRYGLEKLVNGLLPVVDSLEQAMISAQSNVDSAMYNGLDITMKMFLNVLEKMEVRQIDPQGQPFNPQLHEAMSIQESPDLAANSVMTVFQKGYLLNDRMIRPARVVVSKEKTQV
jgi:molecular chaperone GrpE